MILQNTPTSFPTIGIIGLGNMGQAIARRLHDLGVAPVVLATARHPLPRALGDLAPCQVSSPAALARRCDVVLSCLPSSAAVLDVTQGPDGLLAGPRAGMVHVDHTTGDPEVARRLDAAYRQRQGAFVDAAMLRTPRDAARGELVLLLGGDAATLDAVDGVLALYSARRLRVGAVGAGHTLKTIASFVGLGAAAVIAESYALLDAAGLDASSLHEAVTGSGADSGTFQALSAALLRADAALPTRQLSLGNARLAVAGLAKLAASLDAPAPMAHCVGALLDSAVTRHGAQAMISSLAELHTQRPTVPPSSSRTTLHAQ